MSTNGTYSGVALNKVSKMLSVVGLADADLVTNPDGLVITIPHDLVDKIVVPEAGMPLADEEELEQLWYFWSLLENIYRSEQGKKAPQWLLGELASDVFTSDEPGMVSLSVLAHMMDVK